MAFIYIHLFIAGYRLYWYVSLHKVEKILHWHRTEVVPPGLWPVLPSTPSELPVQLSS
jgi:hypothetical protein